MGYPFSFGIDYDGEPLEYNGQSYTGDSRTWTPNPMSASTFTTPLVDTNEGPKKEKKYQMSKHKFE